jgi:hypothetical protein
MRIAYMPPATEFNYYIAIGEGIKGRGRAGRGRGLHAGPQSGADINGQMGMIQDVHHPGCRRDHPVAPMTSLRPHRS